MRQQSADADKVKGTDWASKVAVTGDVRYRYEAISDDTLNAAPPAGVTPPTAIATAFAHAWR